MSVHKRTVFHSIKSAAAAALFCVSVSPLMPAWAQDGVPLVHFSVSGFDVEGDNPLTAEATQAILKEFVGEHAGVEGLQAAADELEAAMNKAGYPFHRVTLPPQKALGGVVKLKILTFTLGEVVVKGNQFFDAENIRASVPALVEGEVPDTVTAGEQIEFANQHPSKQVRMVVKDSETEDAVNVELDVQDVDPVQTFATMSNTGSASSGHMRVGVGYIDSNLSGRDDSLTFTYTTSPLQIDKVTQFGAVYRIPFYGTDTALTLNGVYSNVDSGEVATSLNVQGAGVFVGAKLEHSLPKQGNVRQTLKLAFDDKLFLNDIALAGVALGTNVSSRPLTAGYSMSYTLPETSFNLGLDYVRNVQGGRDNNDRAYTASRAGATADWELWRLTASSNVQLPQEWSWRTTFSAQYTSDTLISGEQFGFGGSQGLRGFTEREVVGDKGYSLLNEVWTPLIREKVQLLAFIDHGEIQNNRSAAGEVDRDSATSVGAGLRAQLTQDASFSLDFGRIVNAAGTSQRGDTGFHGSLFYKF